MMRDPLDAGQPSDSSRVTPNSKRLRPVVLIAEDNADIREALGYIVERAGYEVAQVANGAEALEFLHREAPPIVVLLDLMMPVLDGWSVLAERNREAALSTIPVIVLSAQRGIADKVAAAHASYLEKPIMPDRLIEEIERFS
jgi:CheY-like chemotaxis protein